MRRQRGMLLLPVVLVLSVVGALTFAMSHDASMAVSAVEREYEIARVRYLGEAGVALAKWQNEQEGCGKARTHNATVSFPGGAVKVNNVARADYGVNVDVTATLTQGDDGAIRPAALTIRRDLRLHDLGSRTEATLGAPGGADTHLTPGTGALDGLAYLEVTDQKSHGLIRFSLAGIPTDVIVTKAELRLTQYDVKSGQAPRTLSVHRVTADWNATEATWTSPWPAGGDYAAPALASTPIDGAGIYRWRLDALVESWVNQTLPAYGLLLKPNGLTEARFYSFDNGSDAPELFVRYYPSCPRGSLLL